MNREIQRIHQLLLAQHSALAAKLGEEQDPDKAGAILAEMRETLHRIDLVQGLLFRETSQALQRKVEKIQQASDALTRSLGSIRNIGEFIKSVTTFLRYVDEAIDLAKTLAPIP